MKKLLVTVVGNKMPVFAIRREKMNDGSERLTPMVKFPGWFQDWRQITKIQGNYYVPVEISGDKYVFTESECKKYIDGYKVQIEKENANKIVNVTYQEVTV